MLLLKKMLKKNESLLPCGGRPPSLKTTVEYWISSSILKSHTYYVLALVQRIRTGFNGADAWNVAAEHNFTSLPHGEQTGGSSSPWHFTRCSFWVCIMTRLLLNNIKRWCWSSLITQDACAVCSQRCACFCNEQMCTLVQQKKLTHWTLSEIDLLTFYVPVG